MSIPVASLKKQQLIWLAGRTCKKHRVAYLSHYNCYLDEMNPNQRIGFLDIECSNLKADFGVILSYCIKVAHKNEILGSVWTEGMNKKEIWKQIVDGNQDRPIVQRLVKDLGKFDKVVTWYGTKFDIPFIRTRARILKVPFLTYGTLLHNDDYYISKHKLLLSSNRLENVARNVLDKTNKTHIESRYWRAGAAGDKKSLDYIFDHNKRDVIDLEKVHWKLIEYSKQTDKSI